jgi:signal transduction histidine kinase
VSRLPALAIAAGCAAFGALLALAIGAGALTTDELDHMIVFLAPAIAITVGATAIVAPRLARASLRLRLVAIAAFATLIGLLNLGILASLMLVSGHGAVQVALLLVYSTGAAVGAALAAAKTSADALDRLSDSARRMAQGDLEARTGRTGAGPELDTLAATLDEMAERLSASLERERAAEAQRRDLVTAVSHDLRTPLAGLRAMVEAIEDGVVRDPATIGRYVGEMRSSVESLIGLVDDLFELVWLDAGAIEAETRRARLDEIVGAAVAACDAQATEKGLSLQTNLREADAALTSPRLTRVVQNLIQNAIRHTPADGTVSVKARRGNGGVEVIVEDSGEGIEPDAIERVFDPFWRGDTARAGDGAGLGLALAKRIVESLGGTIVVDSEPARGSRFAVFTPDPVRN